MFVIEWNHGESRTEWPSSTVSKPELFLQICLHLYSSDRQVALVNIVILVIFVLQTVTRFFCSSKARHMHTSLRVPAARSGTPVRQKQCCMPSEASSPTSGATNTGMTLPSRNRTPAASWQRRLPPNMCGISATCQMQSRHHSRHCSNLKSCSVSSLGREASEKAGSRNHEL